MRRGGGPSLDCFDVVTAREVLLRYVERDVEKIASIVDFEVRESLQRGRNDTNVGSRLHRI